EEHVRGGDGAARRVDADHERLHLRIVGRLLELLAHANEERYARGRRRDVEQAGGGLVAQESREIQEDDLRVAASLDGLFLEGPDARRQIDRQHRAARGEQGDEQEEDDSHDAEYTRQAMRSELTLD